MDPEETSLVAALRAGEPAALDSVYRLHHPAVWRFVARLCRPPIRPEDIFQETWLAAARAARRLAPDSRLKPWLFTIARNKLRDTLRARRTDVARTHGVAAEPHAAVVIPLDVAMHRQGTGRLEVAWRQLDEDAAEVLLLCVVEELPTPHVAAMLGLKEDAVRKRLSRARAALRQHMEEGRHVG